nr:MAG TPA: hypothetical protein [Bacteriophage sp.]
MFCKHIYVYLRKHVMYYECKYKDFRIKNQIKT